jgi:hypothetical protein
MGSVVARDPVPTDRLTRSNVRDYLRTWEGLRRTPALDGMARMRLSLSLMAMMLAGALGAAPAPAQQATPVELRGLVLDHQTEEPIAGARVSVVASWGQRLGSRVTDDQGRFSLEVSRAPAVRLEAGRIGYRPAVTPYLHFDGRTFFEIEIRLDVEAVPLAPLEVVAWSVRRSPVLSGFDDRVTSGYGSYFTRADIERARPVMVSDLLGRVPGIRLRSSGTGQSRIVEMAQVTRMGACPVQVFMDGRLMNRSGEIAIDELATPADLEGLEVYRGLATVPPEFYNEWARCGVVAIWTRRGG